MSRRRFSQYLLLLGAYMVHSAHSAPDCQAATHLSARADNGTQAWSESSWSTLQPSKDLQWVPCYTGKFQCARLQVPLNYHDPEADSAAIALVRLPANVSSDSPDYRGPVLFNPGGPGHSGVDYILEGAEFHQAIMGPQFDIVGFDPRGVQRSTPRIEFYKTQVERVMNHPVAAELNSSRETVASYWARTKNMGALAAERGKEYLAHMNTDHTARDMLTITQAHGREKLQYWGLSYGSVLGYTFAAMFPDKVERLIIDGVVDIEDYYTTRWLSGPADVGKTLQWFFKSCKEVGPESCAFYEDSVETMERKLEGIYAKLIESPIPVKTNVSYGLVDYSLVHPLVFVAMYSPFSQWRPMAAGLQALAEGNGTALYAMFEEAPFECDCDLNNHEFTWNMEALNAFICNDGDPVPPELEAAQKHYRESVDLSKFGSFWASFRIACNGWSPEIPKAQFRGPITGNTSFPMLIIGNTADPATPLAAAKKVSERFSGSVLLTQDSPGHCSVSAPSACTAQIVREYFVNGILPKEGTVCPMTVSLFEDLTAGASATVPSKRDASDQGDVVWALQNLARTRIGRVKSLLRV
ncbi:hypothetical protein V5O48_002482 [Marasmius crinis-equi]|uniref:Alpha/beta-hydrolase n=1 Tax=Marasmius crinis-equi TaxID=585013 RepID=A0ABR3FVZ4_9AGAR